MSILPLVVTAMALQNSQPAQPGTRPDPRHEGTPSVEPLQEGAKVAFPHPLISEVLYSVPSGKGGDANKDGVRSATGDEFVELINPHDKAIELEGYRLTDGQPTGWRKDQNDVQDKPAPPKEKSKDSPKGEPSGGADDHEYEPLQFTFPKLTLQPGEVVVVFNGFEATIPGPVGDSTKAAEKNDKFGGAYVFTMKATSSYQALSNQNDMVVLSAPQSGGGEAVECVRWDFRGQQQDRNRSKDGKAQRPRDKHAESPAKLVENLPNTRNSVQRDNAAGTFIDHVDLDGTLFSPGVFGAKKPLLPAQDEKAKKPGKGPEGK